MYPILFNIVIEEALQKVLDTDLGVVLGQKLIDQALQMMLWQLQKMWRTVRLNKVFVKEAFKLGLITIDTKTKHMHFTRNQIHIEDPLQIEKH